MLDWIWALWLRLWMEGLALFIVNGLTTYLLFIGGKAVGVLEAKQAEPERAQEAMGKLCVHYQDAIRGYFRLKCRH